MRPGRASHRPAAGSRSTPRETETRQPGAPSKLRVALTSAHRAGLARGLNAVLPTALGTAPRLTARGCGCARDRRARGAGADEDRLVGFAILGLRHRELGDDRAVLQRAPPQDLAHSVELRSPRANLVEHDQEIDVRLGMRIATSP